MVDGPCSRCDLPAALTVNGKRVCLAHFDAVLAEAAALVDRLAALTDEQWEDPSTR